MTLKKCGGLPWYKYKKILELHRKLYSGNNKETKIIAALELAVCCQHLTVKEFDWRFALSISRCDLQIMEALAPDVKEYLDNHNTVCFGYCPT